MPLCAYGISTTKWTHGTINNKKGHEVGREIGGHHGEVKEVIVSG